MKRRKKVTDKVLAANQKNAEASTGPTTDRGKRASSGNATKHRLTAKVNGPERDPNNPDYQGTLDRWYEDYEPHTMWEEDLLSEAVSLSKQIARADKLLDRETSNFLAEIEGTMIGSVDGVFASNLTLPIDALDLPIQRGFNCERLIIRASTTKDNIRVGASRGPLLDQLGQPRPGAQMREGTNNNDGTRLEIQAELGSTLDKLRRYRTALVRERYRAMEALRVAQADRLEREGQ
ncbi:MAG: hypothetical protein WA172_04390 [Terriglobales bacterium]